jgi:hypothetical protein
MSISHLENLEQSIADGNPHFACPGPKSNEWYFDESIEALRIKAQKAADISVVTVFVYRLVNRTDVGPDGPFLVVRQILESSPRGEPNFRWVIVGSNQAAELLRDVSEGPTPYFGVVVEETCKPRS